MSAEDVLAGAAPGADGLVVAVTENYPLPGVAHYVGAFGPQPCSAEAAAEVLFGETEASGTSPVSVPGAGVKTR